MFRMVFFFRKNFAFWSVFFPQKIPHGEPPQQWRLTVCKTVFPTRPFWLHIDSWISLPSVWRHAETALRRCIIRYFIYTSTFAAHTGTICTNLVVRQSYRCYWPLCPFARWPPPSPPKLPATMGRWNWTRITGQTFWPANGWFYCKYIVISILFRSYLACGFRRGGVVKAFDRNLGIIVPGAFILKAFYDTIIKNNFTIENEFAPRIFSSSTYYIPGRVWRFNS